MEDEAKKVVGTNPPQKEKEVEPQVESVATPTILSKKLTLSDGQEIEVFKFKAGAYYQAQKVFAEWIAQVNTLVNNTGVNYEKYKDEKGNPDLKKIEEELAEKLSKENAVTKMTEMMAVAGKMGKYKIELVSLALGFTKEEIEVDFYAEDIDKIASVVLDLNQFVKNLKNSVAPIAGLGATK